MYGKDEKMFQALGAKFRQEMSDIEKKIDELQARHDELKTLLYEEPAIDETPSTNPDRLERDYALSDFIRENGSVKREQINEFFEGSNLSSDEIRRTLERCKRRGLIKVKGRSRGAIWSAVR